MYTRNTCVDHPSPFWMVLHAWAVMAKTWVHWCRAQYHAQKCQAGPQIETLPTSLNLYKCGGAIYAVLIKILQIYSQNMMFAHFIYFNNTTIGPDVQFPRNPLQSFDNWRYQSVIHFYMSHHDTGWIFWGVDTLPRSRCRPGIPITCSNLLIRGLNCHLPPQFKSAKDQRAICKVFVKILQVYSANIMFAQFTNCNNTTIGSHV